MEPGSGEAPEPPRESIVLLRDVGLPCGMLQPTMASMEEPVSTIEEKEDLLPPTPSRPLTHEYEEQPAPGQSTVTLKISPVITSVFSTGAGTG